MYVVLLAAEPGRRGMRRYTLYDPVVGRTITKDGEPMTLREVEARLVELRATGGVGSEKHSRTPIDFSNG